ncbi:MAG: SIR2 family protein, partial [Thermoguttaceae bacterium]
MDDLILSLDAFVRAVGIKKNTSHAMFLGAGASITSGVPSAGLCVWEWKRDIFLTNNPGLEDQFTELSLSSVKKRIQAWLDSKGGCPSEGADEEYSEYIRKCYPLAENRRAYFQAKVQAAKPHFGYQLLCAMAEAEIIRSVWTTNFDNLTSRAAANFQLTPVEIGMNSQHRAFRQPTKGELISVALHGDYRYDPLKNTSEELRNQEAALRLALIDLTKDVTLIVCGYSGRDHSIMDALTTAYSRAGTGVLYWCGFGDPIPEAVEELLTAARSNGRTAYYVPTMGFDDLMSRLARFCLTTSQRKQCEAVLTKSTETTSLSRSPFSIGPSCIGGIIKSNAFEITLPTEVLSLEIQNWPSEKTWEWVRQIAREHGFVAVPYRKKLPSTDSPSGSDGYLRRVLAFGIADDVRAAFSAAGVASIARTPIGDDDIRHDDSAMMSLLLQTVVNILADKHHLSTDGRNRLSERTSYETRTCK